jgi:hypothetical protein
MSPGEQVRRCKLDDVARRAEFQGHGRLAPPLGDFPQTTIDIGEDDLVSRRRYVDPT